MPNDSAQFSPRMKIIVVTIIACATAVTCAVLLRPNYSSPQPRYQLYSVEDISDATGKTVKWVYRLDTTSGKAWRMTSKAAINTMLGKDEKGNPRLMWGDGWEEMAESPDAALVKERAEWQRAAASYQSPTPNP
jgi:hypothetical protein